MDSYLEAFKRELAYKSKQSKHNKHKIKDKISHGDTQQEFLQKVVFGRQSQTQGPPRPLIQSLEREVQNLFSENKGTPTQSTEKPCIKIRKFKNYQRQSLCISPRARDSPPKNQKNNNGEVVLNKIQPTVSFYQIKSKMERKNMEAERPQLIFQEAESTPTFKMDKDQKIKVKLPKFQNPPSFLDTFININRSNPVFDQAFLQNPPTCKSEVERAKSMKRAASSVLATIKMVSLGKALKVKSETCNEIKKLGIVRDQQEYKKKATAILFKSKKISELHRSKKKLQFERRKMSEDMLLSQRNIHEIPQLCQSTMHKIKESGGPSKRLKFYGL